jgi:hypothetical protein
MIQFERIANIHRLTLERDSERKSIRGTTGGAGPV